MKLTGLTPITRFHLMVTGISLYGLLITLGMPELAHNREKSREIISQIN
jgi:hypothetical protein